MPTLAVLNKKKIKQSNEGWNKILFGVFLWAHLKRMSRL